MQSRATFGDSRRRSQTVSSRVYQQIYEDLRESILTEMLPESTPLLIERLLAERPGVHCSTVVHAYRDLARDGLIEQRVGSGSRVASYAGQPLRPDDVQRPRVLRQESSRRMAAKRTPSAVDAFSRVSGMPAEYFDKARSRYPNSDMRALRVFLALRTAARRVDNAVGGWLDRSDMTLTKLDVLHLLASAETGFTIGRLHDFLKMTQPNVTFVMHNLERDGLVRREHDPADRRSSLFWITEAGLARIDELSPGHLSAIENALANFPQHDRERFIEMLAIVAEGFEAAEKP